MAEVKGMQAVEAVLFASGKAMEEDHIKELTGLKPQETKKALEALRSAYTERDGALFIWNEGTRWKINVKEEHVNLVKTLVAETELARPVLETLAVVAFRSPVLQSDIIQTRGEGAYAHINELVEKGFLTKEKFQRSYKLKVAEKFYHYFDVEGDADIRKALQDAKQPDIEKYAKKTEKKLGELDVVDALDDAEIEKRRKETQLEIYSIDQMREDDKKHYLNGFEARLQEAKGRIDEAEKDILEQKKHSEDQAEGLEEEVADADTPEEEEPIDLGDKNLQGDYEDKEPQELIKDIDEQIEKLTKKE